MVRIGNSARRSAICAGLLAVAAGCGPADEDHAELHQVANGTETEAQFADCGDKEEIDWYKAVGLGVAFNDVMEAQEAAHSEASAGLQRDVDYYSAACRDMGGDPSWDNVFWVHDEYYESYDPYSFPDGYYVDHQSKWGLCCYINPAYEEMMDDGTTDDTTTMTTSTSG